VGTLIFLIKIENYSLYKKLCAIRRSKRCTEARNRTIRNATCHYHNLGRDNSEGIVTRHGMDDRGNVFQFPAEARCLLFSRVAIPGLGHIQYFVRWIPGTPSPWVMRLNLLQRLGTKALYLHFPYAFMACTGTTSYYILRSS
jgi:hypothetical protein